MEAIIQSHQQAPDESSSPKKKRFAKNAQDTPDPPEYKTLTFNQFLEAKAKKVARESERTLRAIKEDEMRKEREVQLAIQVKEVDKRLGELRLNHCPRYGAPSGIEEDFGDLIDDNEEDDEAAIAEVVLPNPQLRLYPTNGNLTPPLTPRLQRRPVLRSQPPTPPDSEFIRTIRDQSFWALPPPPIPVPVLQVADSPARRSAMEIRDNQSAEKVNRLKRIFDVACPPYSTSDLQQRRQKAI
uniref:Uncharacterized protein n=1 Tax=Caenorhabditis japonica TaxID=281687 RepID=A0A8R1DES9_CAEJA